MEGWRDTLPSIFLCLQIASWRTCFDKVAAS